MNTRSLRRTPLHAACGLALLLVLPLTAAPAGSAAPKTDTTRCATFDGERYCVGLGWTTQSEAQVQARLASAADTAAEAADQPAREHTGDLDTATLLERRAAMSPADRARADRRELAAAARAAGKVRRLRAEADGSRSAADYPRRRSIMKAKRSREQNRWYWCGPATAQAITWGWRKRRQSQKHWAGKLGTTRAGTSITELVRVVNDHTGYDRKKHAGDYVVLDVGDWSFEEWYLLMMRHLEDYRAPVVLHPVLEKRFYPYLDDDASGHFQVGRGFDQNPGGEPLLGYFEPWNQQRFDPSEPFIARNQWQSAYQQYRANLAHPQQNVGV
ncbi:hypothetical protein [Nocardioides campestrisoli]|uniref:hypothetical protein n=1 Tax=Nocardioides campestrisoli TaxID=2736757 RepID=UPI0015E75CEA|nr:hypothetical protein [Nocardioides campestrisoli]